MMNGVANTNLCGLNGDAHGKENPWPAPSIDGRIITAIAKIEATAWPIAWLKGMLEPGKLINL